MFNDYELRKESPTKRRFRFLCRDLYEGRASDVNGGSLSTIDGRYTVVTNHDVADFVWNGECNVADPDNNTNGTAYGEIVSGKKKCRCGQPMVSDNCSGSQIEPVAATSAVLDQENIARLFKLIDDANARLDRVAASLDGQIADVHGKVVGMVLDTESLIRHITETHDATTRVNNASEHRIVALENQLAERKQEHMSNESHPIVKTLQIDATDAAWRTAGSQFVKLAREPLVGLLSRHLGPDDPSLRARIGAFLETEVGAALLAALLSAGLSAVPGAAGEVPQKLARELRVRAMADTGDVLADVLMGPLRQVMALYLQDVGPVVVANVPSTLPDGQRTGATAQEREKVGVSHG